MTAMADTADKEMTIAELASKYKMRQSTIRHWSSLFEVPSKKIGRKNVYTQIGQDMFDLIAEKKVQGLTDKEIKLILDTGSEEPASTQSDVDIQAMITETVTKAISEQTQLAHAYGTAQNQIGRLEERVSNLQALLEEKEKQLKLLPAQVQSLEIETQEFASRAAELQEQVEAITNAKTVVANEKAQLEKEYSDKQKNYQTAMADKEAELKKLREELEQEQKQRKAAESKSEDLEVQKQQIEQALETEKNRGLFGRIFKK